MYVGRKSAAKAIGIMFLIMLFFAETTAQTKYLDANGIEQTITAAPVTGTTANMTSGWYVLSENVTRSSAISVSGTVNLILAQWER